MLKRLTGSLAAKILFVLVPLLVFAQLSVFGVQTWSAYKEQRGVLIERLNELADTQLAALGPALWEFDTVEVAAIATKMAEVPFVAGVVVLDSFGERLAAVGEFDGPVDDPAYRVDRKIVFKADGANQHVGRFVVTAHSGLIAQDVTGRMQENLFLLVALILALTAGAFGATHWFIGRPLQLMRGSIERTKDGQDRQLVDWQSNDGLGNVVEAYNEFRLLESDAKDRLREHQESLERLVDERTHELRMTLDTMSGGIFMLDKSLNFVIFNQRYVDMVALPDARMAPGQPIEDTIRYAAELGYYGPGDVDEQVRTRMADYGGDAPTQRELTTRDGRTLDMRHTPVEGGGAVVVLTDITERKQAEEQIAESENRFRTLVESSPVGLVIVSKDTGKRILVNSIAMDMFGLSSEDELLKGNVAESYVNPDDHTRVNRIFAERGAVAGYEMQRKRADGSLWWCLLNGEESHYGQDQARVNWIVDITQQKDAEAELRHAFAIIDESVQYAANIQRAILPLDELLSLAFSDHFIIWEPRDVVGGDFYLLLPVEGGYLLVVADCTGHGVPGAFVTLVAAGAIRRAVAEVPDADPAKVIASVNRHIKEVLGQYTEDSVANDGLELGVCRIDGNSRELVFAGARFSLWVMQDGAMEEVKGDKIGIGYRDVPMNIDLTNHTIAATEDMRFYIYSDGFNDQVGGVRGRSMGKKRITRVFTDSPDAPMAEQRDAILDAFARFQGDERRRDDITMVGFSL